MKKNSLKKHVWIYLSIFAILIIGGIWLLQILSLNVYYEWTKKNEITSVANQVKSSYEIHDYTMLDILSFKKDICIEITENNNILYTTDSMSRGCIISNSKEINNYKLKFMLSGKKSIILKIINPKFKNKTLIYGIKLDSGVYSFITSSLEPVNSTVNILKNQFVIIIIFIFIISFLIAYLISKKISKPIENITKSSKEIGMGNYNVKFDSNTDISEIKELENTLNKTAIELSKIENLRRELLANVSHDLKTPLTLIKANAEMIKDITYKDKNKQDKNLDTIINEVDRLNLLVSDILDLSKMQSSVEKLKLEEFNLNDMIKSVIDRFKILSDIEGYKINYKGFDYIVKADKKRLEQVIYNLINNAINYTGKDLNIYIDMIDEKDKIRVVVKDTGDGIEDQDLKHIWDKYKKIDKKYKRVTYGTGLGLSIVKKILEMHRFKYGVESKKNKGTNFYFEINKNLKN